LTLKRFIIESLISGLFHQMGLLQLDSYLFKLAGLRNPNLTSQ